MMPNTPCDHCPIRPADGATCHALATGSVRLCQRLDPDSPLFRPTGAEAVRRLTLEPLGRWTPPAPTRPPATVETPASFPPLATQVKHAASDLATFVRSGAAMATDEERGRRLAICATCPNLKNDRCLKCGCSMPYRTRAAAFHCPIGLW